MKYPVKHISVSQLNLYLMCSLKYKFQYVDKLPKPFKPSALAFGSAIHSAIDWLHKEKKKRKEIMLGEFLKIFTADWAAQIADTDIHYKEGETIEVLKDKAETMLTHYFIQGPKNVKASELPFEVPLVNPETGEVLPIPLKGYMDLIEEDETLGEIKTSATAYNADTLDLLLQLTAYHYAYQVLFNREPKEIKLINFTKAKKPKMEVLITQRSQKDHARLFFIAKEILNGIKAEVFVPNPSFRCKECEFFGPCQNWRGNK